MNVYLRCQICNKTTSSGTICAKKQHYYCRGCNPTVCNRFHKSDYLTKNKCKTCLKDMLYCRCKSVIETIQQDICSDCYRSNMNKQFFCNSFCGHFLCKKCWMQTKSDNCRYVLCKQKIDQQSARIFFNCCSVCDSPIEKQNMMENLNLCKKCQFHLQTQNSLSQPTPTKLKEYNQPKQKNIHTAQSASKPKRIAPEQNDVNFRRESSKTGYSEKPFSKASSTAKKKIELTTTRNSPKKSPILPQADYGQLFQINSIIKNKLHIKDNDGTNLKTPPRKQLKYIKEYEQFISKSEPPNSLKNDLKNDQAKTIKMRNNNFIQKEIIFSKCQFCRTEFNSKVLIQNKCKNKHKICRSCVLINRNQKQCTICSQQIKEYYNKLYIYTQADPKQKIQEIQKQNKNKAICTSCNIILNTNKIVEIKGKQVCRNCVQVN